MRVATAHKILIATALVFFLFYAVWEIRHYAEPGGAWAVGRGIIAGLVAIGLGLYLRYVARSLKLR
jgi:hypothetical protein